MSFAEVNPIRKIDRFYFDKYVYFLDVCNIYIDYMCWLVVPEPEAQLKAQTNQIEPKFCGGLDVEWPEEP
jgi:hypothetical protein